MDRGVVCFLGLGPGDPVQRTRLAESRLSDADVVVWDEDALEPSRLVALAAMAREGKRVVRAVAGDPFESEKATAEVRDVARAGVPFEVVPGVGARAAAGAFAGVVGHATRVLALHVQDVVRLAPPGAAVTLVVAAGQPRQRVIVTTVADAPGRARELGDEAVLVAFGTPEESLRWFEHRPLFGKRVLVTRARPQAARSADLLREQGAEPVVVPTLVLAPPRDPAPLGRALESLRAGAYGWVAFTSANGVDCTWNALVAAGGDARAFGGAKLAAIGPATAGELEKHGLHADLVAKEFRGEGLAEVMLRVLNETPDACGVRLQGREGSARNRVLVPRAAKARDVLPDALRAAGCVVDVVAAYETHPPPQASVDGLVRELEAGRLDAVTFTSSSTVENLCDLLGPRAVELLARTRIASIGPVTSETAAARGLRVDVTAREYTIPGLVRALVESWAPAR
ncbi:MAG: uroporphyrinogen-III synthase [Myxococcota bacterium]|nr:uroporphyrinogen-III synthase [Myxococcota bacterium]